MTVLVYNPLQEDQLVLPPHQFLSDEKVNVVFVFWSYCLIMLLSQFFSYTGEAYTNT